ncbi:acyltransferase family protein [Paraburkholderia strydomiana]|uniref:Acyltransferase n=1 Tax=Paraburkholderia strydomiana TaxID=1245417 RepID=A0ABW9BVC0_9BURK
MQPKNQEIESLRAIAVLITCMNHIGLLFRWNIHPLGRLEPYLQFWGGVDLFFCISGYVVSRSFMNALDRSRADGTHWHTVKAFWVRRAYRLLPSAWFWLAFGLCCAVFFNRTGIFGSAGGAVRSSVAVLSMTANLSQYFGVPMHPNGVYWSLALEEQFYLLFPFFLLAVPFALRWKLLLFAIAIQLPLTRTYAVDLSWFLRLDALMWGILIAMFSRTAEYRIFQPYSLSNRTSATCVSIALICALIALPAMLERDPFHVGLMAIASAALVFIASYDRGYALPVGHLKHLFLWVGSRSYAIYLSHLPAFMLTHEVWTRWTEAKGLLPPNGTYTVRYTLTALTLIAILSELNYRLIETPLRLRGARLAKTIVNHAVATASV